MKTGVNLLLTRHTTSADAPAWVARGASQKPRTREEIKVWLKSLQKKKKVKLALSESSPNNLPDAEELCLYKDFQKLQRPLILHLSVSAHRKFNMGTPLRTKKPGFLALSPTPQN